ncbi:hypothetical protein SK128_006063 [Halocaridina rubra]|uniref:Serendipity locus protein alpha n=1 Tax=Halocaridina rubra TaxID=373956 RepID=A0AAN9A3H8_HALRR
MISQEIYITGSRVSYPRGSNEFISKTTLKFLEGLKISKLKRYYWENLNMFQMWSEDNLLPFHSDKCKYLKINSRRRAPENTEYYLEKQYFHSYLVALIMENIENCTKSKSVLNALGPIAKQVVELKSKYGTLCDASTVMALLKQCQSLRSACSLLIFQLSCYAQSCKDAVLSSEVQRVKERLDNIIDSLSDFTRDLHRGDVGVRDNDEVWSDIVEDTEQLLSILTDAILAWDRAQVRKISKSVAQIQECLTCLHQTRFIHKLPEDFQALVTACGKLLNLVEERCEDLYQRSQSEYLQQTALQLCHTLHLLADTCALTVSHPLSKHIKGSRELVVDRIQSLLKDIECLAGPGKEVYDMDEAGTFVVCVDRTLDLLSNVKIQTESAFQSSELLSDRVKVLLEEVLKHGVAVAFCSSQNDNKAIMAKCENVLKHLKNIVNLERTESCDAVDFQLACDNLADHIEVLEQKVNTALIRQIVKTFASPYSALETLIKSLESEKTDILDKDVENDIADFDLHVDHIFQVGGFAAACTTDVTKVRLIRDSLLTLEWLESCLIPALLCARNEWHPHAILHAKILSKKWILAVKQIGTTLDRIMDASAFALVTKQEVHYLWAKLKEELYDLDTTSINKQVEEIVALASRVISLHDMDNFLTEHQEEDLRIAITEIQKSMSSILNCPADQSCHRRLLKRVQLLLTLLSRLANSLNEENLQYLDDFTSSDPMTSPCNGGFAKLSDEQKCQLLTSNIDDIPLDVATPVAPVSTRNYTENSSHVPDRNVRLPKQLRRSMRSTSRLGESKALAHPTDSMQAATSETLGLDTSIDISKFLSRSVNILQNSTRSSKRNFSLKVKEINLDIDGAVKSGLPPLTARASHSLSDLEGDLSQSKGRRPSEDIRDLSLDDVSEMISKEGSLGTSQQSIENELTGILENLTSLAGDLTALAASSASPSSSSSKRKCTWENFDEEKENLTSLCGIKLLNASFNPQFPEIVDKNTSNVSFDSGKLELKTDTAYSKNEKHDDVHEVSSGFSVDLHVWKDFTAILQAKTPGKTGLFNFTNDFGGNPVSQTQMSSSFGKTNSSKGSLSNSKELDLSDTPFMVKVPSTTTLLSKSFAASCTSLSRIGNSSGLFSSNYSVSPSSAAFGTPQRLMDIQLVQQRLQMLRNQMK